MMKKRLLAWIILLALAVSGCASAYDGKEHDHIMQLVLFGSKNYSVFRPKKEQEAVHALSCACYLALDQFNGAGEEELAFLREYKVPDLPEQIESIDFSANQYHRSYTHRGWNAEYPKDLANWPVRKTILLATVEKVFDFSILPSKLFGLDLGYGEQCESFAAFLYLVHVLGDYDAQEDYKRNDMMLPFAVAHVPPDNRDMFFELKNHLEVLFEEQLETHTYRNMLLDINMLEIQARELAASTGGVNDEEKFAVMEEQVDRLLEILQMYVPRLLQNEEFFTDVFSN